MRIMTILFCAAAVLMAAWVAYGALAVSRVEEPPYQVLKSEQGIEIRLYEPYRVAEVRVAGGYEIASSQGFRLLARYIFGHNVRQQKMAMTKPVIQNPAAGNENRIGSSQGDHRVRFVMSPSLKLNDLPKPIDGQVTLIDVPAHRVAVRRFSGTFTEEKAYQQADALRKTLKSLSMPHDGALSISRYNPPGTPPFMMRHEVWIALPDR
ncbi:MAG: SOUL family heme-binding protein [Bradymonadia bacterium]